MLTRKTYETELFARASLKLGLERAVLHGVTAGRPAAAPAGSALAIAAARASAHATQDDPEAQARSKSDGKTVAALATSEIEAVLKYGAYDIFAEEREGKAEEESKKFCEADIDHILSTRTTTLVEEQVLETSLGE